MNIKKIYIILAISFIVRLFMAASIELGNDEVYYRILALFPDWSYFDHPPMVAWLIRLTTMGAEVTADLWVRFGAVVIGTINTYVIYRIASGRSLSGGSRNSGSLVGSNNAAESERRGLIAALLYTGSIYASVILGTFILPDTPLSLFWLLTLWIFIEIIPEKPNARSSKKMLLAGIFIGLAMLSKYTGAYLWGAAFLYILLYNRSWFKQWALWVAPLISLMLIIPVIYWNVENAWISFTFHGARVTAENSINWLYFGREVMGGVFYNNPVNFVLVICAIVALSRGKFKSDRIRFLLIFSLPMILLFLAVSLTRETLPHWAAPAYFALMLLAAQWLVDIKWAWISTALVGTVLVLGFVQIQYGILDVGGNKEGDEIGRGDFTLDTYGWRQGGEKFAELHNKYVSEGLMPADATLTQYGWDDAAHVDCYFGLPIGLKTKALGSLGAIHYYEWINERRGSFRAGEDMYLISTSRYFRTPQDLGYDQWFEDIHPADTLEIYRGDKHVMNFYVYRLKNMRIKKMFPTDFFNLR